jgi:hypothetical protein
MPELRQLFSSVAVTAEFHPRARALRFWRDQSTQALCSSIVYFDKPLTIKEELEADIAGIAARLSDVALPDYHAFCVDVDAIFSGAQPTGPITTLQDLDWKTFRKISSYAQYWQERNPREVAKLVSFVMAIPVFSQLVGQLIVDKQSKTEKQIYRQIAETGGTFILGVGRFKALFAEEIDMAYNEARLLVSTFRGTKSDEAARIVNGMVASMVKQQ